MSTSPEPVLRHRTAIHRRDLSRPIKCVLGDALLDPASTLLDYGCGHGEDVRLLSAQGYPCCGWDPAFHPHVPLQEADVVDLGCVINVIEDPRERAEALRRAWQLTEEDEEAEAQFRRRR